VCLSKLRYGFLNPVFPDGFLSGVRLSRPPAANTVLLISFLRIGEQTKASYAFGKFAKVFWERNEEVEGIATVAGVTEIQVPLLQECSAEGAALRTLADPCGAWDSLLVLPALL